jgi:hypothetical protein
MFVRCVSFGGRNLAGRVDAQGGMPHSYTRSKRCQVDRSRLYGSGLGFRKLHGDITPEALRAAGQVFVSPVPLLIACVPNAGCPHGSNPAASSLMANDCFRREGVIGYPARDGQLTTQHATFRSVSSEGDCPCAALKLGPPPSAHGHRNAPAREGAFDSYIELLCTG